MSRKRRSKQQRQEIEMAVDNAIFTAMCGIAVKPVRFHNRREPNERR